jgi:ornithine decarboxylase
LLRSIHFDTDTALRIFAGTEDDDLMYNFERDERDDDRDEREDGVELALDEDLTLLAVDENAPMLKRMPDAHDEPASPGYQFQAGPTSSRAISRVGSDVWSGSNILTNEKQLERLTSIKTDRIVAENMVAGSEYIRGSWQFQKCGKRAGAAKVLSDASAENIEHGGPKGIENYALRLIRQHQLDDTLYVYDLANVYRMWRAWRTSLPRVTPYYAVKCNPNPFICRLLMSLGAGFDCASKGELAAALDLGMPPERIIFAHPCKPRADIQFAKEHGIQFTTFDTISELDKIAQYNPKFRCVLRIRADDPDARVPLGLKYGADIEDVSSLLAHAKSLGLKVSGVSFHVGSGAKNLSTFSGAIATARAVFDMAELLGFHMELLDIGGGFTGTFDTQGNVMFGDIAAAINAALDQEFPQIESESIRIIAEPGRYFAETAATLFCPVYGKRDRVIPGPEGKNDEQQIHKDYFITDGLYGSFNCIIYDDQKPEFTITRSPILPSVDAKAEKKKFLSTIWGPTCDSADCVYKDVLLPELRNQDWLQFPRAGAYTVAGACDFNGWFDASISLLPDLQILTP